MVKFEWVDFTIEDLSIDECEIFTKEKFEKMLQDKFVAVDIDDDGFPKYIWTERFVVGILKRHRLMGQVAMAVFPRNPDCK